MVKDTEPFNHFAPQESPAQVPPRFSCARTLRLFVGLSLARSIFSVSLRLLYQKGPLRILD